MTEVKKYIWVFPVIVGILAIVSLLTPVASMDYMGMGMLTADLWMWDLYTYNFNMVLVGTEFVTELMVMIPSLITTSLIAIGGAVSLVCGLRLRRNGDIRKIIAPSALMGILFIVGELLWLILVPANFPMETFFGPLPPEITFWNISSMGITIPMHTMGFGVIGGFLAAILAFIAAGVARYYSKEREVIVPEKKEIE